jgi:hypothetical protein
MSFFTSPRLFALGIPMALMSQCAPTQSCTPAPPTESSAPVVVEQPVVQPPADCHPDYVECLPIVADLDCGDIGHPVHLHDPRNDAYRLDGLNNAVGDGVGCE